MYVYLSTFRQSATAGVAVSGNGRANIIRLVCHRTFDSLARMYKCKAPVPPSRHNWWFLARPVASVLDQHLLQTPDVSSSANSSAGIRTHDAVHRAGCFTSAFTTLSDVWCRRNLRCSTASTDSTSVHVTAACLRNRKSVLTAVRTHNVRRCFHTSHYIS